MIFRELIFDSVKSSVMFIKKWLLHSTLFFIFSDKKQYMYTKQKYAPVHANSPMFAVDCEMVSLTMLLLKI